MSDYAMFAFTIGFNVMSYSVILTNQQIMVSPVLEIKYRTLLVKDGTIYQAVQ